MFFSVALVALVVYRYNWRGQNAEGACDATRTWSAYRESILLVATTPEPGTRVDQTIPVRADVCNEKPPLAADWPHKWKPLRWLFLQTEQDQRLRMDPFFRVLVEGARTSPLVEGTGQHWGEGFPDWKRMSLKDNIKQMHNSAEYFDVIFTVANGGSPDYPAEFNQSRVVIGTRKHECRQCEQCDVTLRSGSNDIVAMMNPFEMNHNPDIKNMSHDMLLFYTPFPTLERIYYADPQERTVDIMLLGAFDKTDKIWGGMYPLREAWFDMLSDRGRFGLGEYKVHIYKHPGHFDKHKTLEDQLNQTGEYARQLKSTKILLTDSSAVHYSLQKYSEALVAGCLIIGDMPHDRTREYRRFSVEVPTRSGPEHLARVVKYWVEHDAERLAKVEAGQEWALRNVMPKQFFEDFTEMYYERRSEARDVSTAVPMLGKHFAYPHYTRCRASGGEAWCAGEAAARARIKRPHWLGPDPDLWAPRHPSFGGMVNPDDTLGWTSQQLCASTEFEGPSYRSRWQPLRWLFLSKRPQIVQNVQGPGSRTWFGELLMTAHSRRSIVSMAVEWGPGWVGWDDSLDNNSAGGILGANLAKRFGSSEHFDVIFYHADIADDLTAGYAKLRTVVMTAQQACATAACARRLSAGHPNVVALGNPHEMVESKELDRLSHSSLLVHTPPFARPPRASLAPPKESVRSVDVLLLRSFASGVGSWASSALVVETFNMTRVQSWAPSELATKQVSDVDATAIDELHAVLHRTKLVLTDTTDRHYWTPELSYAMAAGAVVVSNTPRENSRVFRHCSIELPLEHIPLENGGATLITVKQLALLWASPERAVALRKKADAGHRFWRMNLTPDAFLDAMMESYFEVVSPPYGEGLVGKKFPWAFSVTCRSDGGEEWCKAAKDKQAVARKHEH